MSLEGACTAPSEWKKPGGGKATADFYSAIHDSIIVWWRRNQRQDLPWRKFSDDGAGSFSPYDSYTIWIAEVMSQQTQMSTVIKYFDKWMQRFPTIEALALSTEDEVRSVWAGMGYYRRAHYLRKGALYLVDQHRKNKSKGSAVLPKTSTELLKVPGIGPYTAAAIASVCYKEPIISVDGNVFRVLCRLRGEHGMDPKIPGNIKTAHIWGQQLMLGEGEAVCAFPGDLNQGLMELGSSLCKPTGAPLCSQCPLRVYCVAYTMHQQRELPAIEGVIPLRGTVASKRVEHAVAVVHEFVNGRGGTSRFVVERRPRNGLLGGMLGFPSLTFTCDADTVVSSTKEADMQCFLGEKEALAHLSCGARENVTDGPLLRNVGKVTHIFSHIYMTVFVYHVQWNDKVTNQCSVSPIADEISLKLKSELIKIKGVDYSCTSICVISRDDLASAATTRLFTKILHIACPLALSCGSDDSEVKRYKREG